MKKKEIRDKQEDKNKYYFPEYKKYILDRTLINEEDLSKDESEIISISYDLWMDKMNEIKDLNDELKRLTIENLNLKSFNDDIRMSRDEDC
jgi:hypothetical protein